MPSAPQFDAMARPRWELALVLGLPLAAALWLGLDSNWDLRNYHLYNPHALLAGRHADIAAAQLQGWHSPLLDIPMYLLAMSGLPARVVAIWLAVPMMVALACLLRLQRMCSPDAPTVAARVALVLLAISGAGAWSTFALSMNDGFVAAGMLAALCIALGPIGGAQGPVIGRTRALPWRWVAAGAVAGGIGGLKLTAAGYCLALAGAVLVGGSAPERLRKLIALAAGGIVGMLVAYGPWGWHLQQATGNPFFPYFNHLFKSPEALPLSYVDERFHPRSVADALLAPIRLLRTTDAFSELKLRDPRMLLGLLGFAWLAWRTRRSGVEATAITTRLRALAVFMLLGCALWLAQSGIYRYAVVLEMLGALAMVLVLQRVPRGGALAIVVAVLLVSADTRRPDWGRDGTGASFAELRAPFLGIGAMVLTASGDPLAYLALGLPRDVPLLGVDNNFIQPTACDGLQSRLSARIVQQRGPIWLLEDPGQPGARSRAMLLTDYGLVPGGDCLAYPNPLGPARLCRLVRAVAARAPCQAQRK